MQTCTSHPACPGRVLVGRAGEAPVRSPSAARRGRPIGRRPASRRPRPGHSRSCPGTGPRPGSSWIVGGEREGEGEEEEEGEGGTTLESRDCPVWCAALTGSRLPSQAPAAPKPLDPGGGGASGPPLLGKGTNKSGISLMGERKSSPSQYKSRSGRAPAPSLGGRPTVARPCKPSWVLLPPPTPP